MACDTMQQGTNHLLHTRAHMNSEHAIDTLATVTDVAVVTADATTSTISAEAMTDLTFYLWIVVPLLTVFMATQYSTIRDRFYANHFKTAIRPFMVMLFMMVTDIMTAISITYYMWNTKNPPVGTETSWFISIFSLWFIVQAMKAAWSLLFWTYGSELIALGASFAISIIMNLCSFVLAALFFNKASYVSGALTLVVSILYVALVVFCGLVFFRSWRKRAPRKNRDTYMMQPQQQPPQQQQQQQQQQYMYPPQQQQPQNGYPGAPRYY